MWLGVSTHQLPRKSLFQPGQALAHSAFANTAEHTTTPSAVADVEEMAPSSSAGRYVNEKLSIRFPAPTYFKHTHVETPTQIPYHHIVYQIIMP